MAGLNYVSIDHSKSFAGETDFVQAKPLENTELPSLTKHSATVILLHGFANSGAAWVPIANHIQSALPHVRLHLLNAPLITVHVPRGLATLPAWWDPYLSGKPLAWEERTAPLQDQENFLRSKKKVEELIKEEAKLVGPGRVFLAGFSQGTVLALAVGLENENVGGIIALSSWLSVADSFKSETPDPSAASKAIFWGHGKADFLSSTFAEKSVDYLVDKAGLRRIEAGDKPEPGTISLHLYEGLGHTTSTEEIETVTKWLSVTLPDQ